MMLRAMYRKVLLVGVGGCFFVRSALWFFLPLPMVVVCAKHKVESLQKLETMRYFGP